MEALGLLIHGFAVLLTWKTLLLMMLGLVLGIFRRGAARPRRPERRSDPAAADVYDGSNLGDRDAVLHLLGALFGGAITSILFNIPGEAWSVATNRGCLPVWW